MCREEKERRVHEEFLQNQEEECVSSYTIIQSTDIELDYKDGGWTDKSSIKDTKPSEEVSATEPTSQATSEIPETIDMQMDELHEIESTKESTLSASEPLSLTLEPPPIQPNALRNLRENALEFNDVKETVEKHNENKNEMEVQQPTGSDAAQVSHFIEFYTGCAKLSDARSDELDAMPEKEICPIPSIPTSVPELLSCFIKNVGVEKNATAENQNVGYVCHL